MPLANNILQALFVYSNAVNTSRYFIAHRVNTLFRQVYRL